MIEVLKLKKKYSPFLDQVEKNIIHCLKKIESKSNSKILERIKNNKGKQLRPLFLIICIETFRKEELTKQQLEDATTIASIIELIHTASLIHDDVIDNSQLRRGKKTINSLFGNSAAVAFGTSLYATSLEQLCMLKNITLIENVAQTVKNMCYGELLQIAERKNSSLSILNYFRTIKYKTCDLFSLTCENAGHLINKNDKEIKKLKRIGFLIGLLYQLTDDIIDFQENINIGKKTGEDLDNGLITLPLLLSLKEKPVEDQSKYIKMIKNPLISDMIIGNLKKENYTNIERKLFAILEKCKIKIKILLKEANSANNDCIKVVDIISKRTKQKINIKG